MYTAEVYKVDRRNRNGERLVFKKDLEYTNCDELQEALNRDYPVSEGYRVVLHETMITKTNAMTGKKYQERYDTPLSCSPSSETYWAM
mgnify:FL=1